MDTTRLTARRTEELCRRLNDGMLAEGIVAAPGAGMGYDGVSVEVRDLGCTLYFDTTYGGDDGYAAGLRCYVTLGDECVDDGWGLPAGPGPDAPAGEQARHIATASRAVVEQVLRREVPGAR